MKTGIQNWWQKKSLKNIEGQCPEKKRSKFKINRAKIDFIKKTLEENWPQNQ
jgi:hypothetical protein